MKDDGCCGSTDSDRYRGGIDDLVLIITDAFSEKLTSHKTPKFDKLLKELHSIYESDNVELVVLYQQSLNRCIPMIGKELFRVIDAVFLFPWFIQETKVVGIFSTFLTNLTSIHPFFAHSAIDMLVGNLQYNRQQQYHPSYLEVHDLIKKILTIIPPIMPFLVNSLGESFPHASQDLKEQQVWLENVFMICDYLPTLRNRILELLIEKLIELDFCASEQQEQWKEMAEDCNDGRSKIDSLLYMLLEYLSSLAERKLLQDTFYALLISFERLLLCTFKSKHVQFFMYFICSLQADYSEVFLGMLVSNLIKPNSISNGDISKGITANYIASFVSRASFLDSASVIWSFLLLLEWTDSYLATYEEKLYNIEKHCVFFSVSQAILYVFCFRHKQILQDPDIWYQIQNSLSKLVNSTLNPLKVCLTSVVLEFARISAQYQLVYCFNILEKNRKIGSISNGSNETTLDLLTMFPFDPIDEQLMQECSKFFPKSLFITWGSSESCVGDGDGGCYELIDGITRDAPTPPNSCAPIGMDRGDKEEEVVGQLHKTSSFLLLNFDDYCFEDQLEI